jgi:hypothetical protein
MIAGSGIAATMSASECIVLELVRVVFDSPAFIRAA